MQSNSILAIGKPNTALRGAVRRSFNFRASMPSSLLDFNVENKDSICYERDGLLGNDQPFELEQF